MCEGTELAASTGFLKDGLGEFAPIPDVPPRDRFLLLTQSVALGTELTESLTVFVEFFHLFSQNLADESTQGFFNVGVDYYHHGQALRNWKYRLLRMSYVFFLIGFVLATLIAGVEVILETYDPAS